MIYDAFAHLPICGLEDLGFVGRGTAPAQVPGARVSVAHGVGGMFAAAGTVVLSNERP